MPSSANSPLLLNYYDLVPVFFARVKVNHRRVYSHILVKVCAVAMPMGPVKTQGLKNGFHSLFKKNPVVRISSRPKNS